MEEPIIETLAETKNFNAWQAEEPDGETTYHLELGVVTVHLFREEWKELVDLVAEADVDEEVCDLELDIVTVHFPRAKWEEFQKLIGEAGGYAAEE